MNFTIISRILRQTIAKISSRCIRNTRARVLTWIRITQVNLNLAIVSLIAGRAHAQIPQTRIVIAYATVETRRAAAGSQCHTTVASRVTNRTRAQVASRCCELRTIAANTRVTLTRRYDLITVYTTNAVRTYTHVLLSTWY